MDYLDTQLNKKFGFQSFKSGQKEIISSLLEGHDVFAMLPTGGGKSLCYLLPGSLMNGTVIIVSPLLSLMEDQVHQLRLLGERRVVALNSFLNPRERKAFLRQLKNYKFIFISPEMLQQLDVQSAFLQLNVSLFVVDEAHCISQWGHDFRPDYLNIAEFSKKLRPERRLALTATATEKVIEDIYKHFPMTNKKSFLHPVDRSNIYLGVEAFQSVEEKKTALLSWIKKSPGAVIVYCGTRDWTESLAMEISAALNKKTAFYHGGMTHDDRLRIQQQFINDQLEVICATNAFGMGINKKNIRMVIHFHIAKHMNEYVQEIGRAGRDGEQSYAITLYSEGDEALGATLIDFTLPEGSLVEQYLDMMHQYYKPELYPSLEQFFLSMGVNETVSRYLSYYVLKGEKTEKELPQVIESMRQEKMLELEIMEQYFRIAKCRRSFILNYYNEEIKQSSIMCCDRCHTLPKLSGRPITIQETLDTWEGILSRLFNQKTSI